MKNRNRDNVLLSLINLIDKNRKEIIAHNQRDMELLRSDQFSMGDRLKVDSKKIEGMINSLREVAQQENPVGKTLYSYTQNDGLQIINRTVPFGTILIIYESRPDVTIEAAATAFKAGNRIFLKGGRESHNSNLFLTHLWQIALAENGFEKGYVEYLNISREETQSLIKGEGVKIDLIIPRGGERLIKYIKEQSSVPIIVSGRGNNFIYIEKECDIEMAYSLVLNGKARVSVCNAIDKVLIDKSLPNLSKRIEELVTLLKKSNIEVVSSSDVASLHPDLLVDDSEEILFEEFLAPKIWLSLVEGVDQAIEIINKYSGGHSAVIVTKDSQKAEYFMERVDCAAVYHNASSRFTDGGQFGVGAEIAISTQKLHFRGPLGANELVTNKWFIRGRGEVRE